MTDTIRVLSTGGTIASTGGEAGASPSKRGEELVASVPELGDHADLSVEEIAQIPSFDMGWTTIDQVIEAAEAAGEEADGVVVTHGTDTMEESAYVTDVTFDGDVPVVFTGAQRRPDEPSPDGPSNLLTAVRAAADDRFQSAGAAYVAFDERVHAARDVTKAHTSDLGTFRSPDKGPVAALTRSDVRIYRSPGSRSVDLPRSVPEATVRVVKSGLGVAGESFREAVDAGADGIVLEGTGLGNATAALGDAVAEAIGSGVPVVVTSRCQGGATAPVYGTGGGGETLSRHGAVFADDLPAHKARLKLALALEAAGDGDGESVAERFGSYR